MSPSAPSYASSSEPYPQIQNHTSYLQNLFLSTSDAARILCMCPRSVRNLVAAGHLHAFRPNMAGRKYLLYTSEVVEYAKAAQKPAQDAAQANIQRLRALIHS